MAGTPELAAFVGPHPLEGVTIDFADPAAVTVLNRALLKFHYGVAHWEIPPGYLCPPVPGRADYLHHVADLLSWGAARAIPRGPSVAMLDIGVGANCVYPLIGVHEYGWRFVGTDVHARSVEWARTLVQRNPSLAGRVEIRRQFSPRAIFEGVVHPGETFAACLCNPPFHASSAAAAEGSLRKVRNLGSGRRDRSVLNFGGQDNELWCEGGESVFVRRMIAESVQRPTLCRWFTSLVSKRGSLPAIHQALARAGAADVRTIPMGQGQKQSRLVAWTFAPPAR